MCPLGTAQLEGVPSQRSGVASGAREACRKRVGRRVLMVVTLTPRLARGARRGEATATIARPSSLPAGPGSHCVEKRNPADSFSLTYVMFDCKALMISSAGTVKPCHANTLWDAYLGSLRAVSCTIYPLFQQFCAEQSRMQAMCPTRIRDHVPEPYHWAIAYFKIYFQRRNYIAILHVPGYFCHGDCLTKRMHCLLSNDLPLRGALL